jgi:DNA-binding GntR family transcriptional regulator
MENIQNLINFDVKQIRNLRDRISDSIRDSIIEGKLQPGERLTEPEVALQLGVSRTPLREAFLQLEAEGFLTVNPRKGAVVSALSLKDAEETYEIKSSLEALAARLAVKFIDISDLTFLQGLNNSMRRIANSEDKNYKEFLELNAEFHQKINDNCGNEKLTKSILVLRNQTLRYNYIYLSLISHLDESVLEHDEIISALENKDESRIEILIKNHGENARKALKLFFNDQKQISY